MSAEALWGECVGRAWKVCWIPELTLLDKLDAKCCLERQDKILEDRGIKGSAASEILLKYFSYHCTSLSVQSPHFLMGTISMCILFTKTVIGGHLSKPLSFWYWGYRVKLWYISILKASAILPAVNGKKQCLSWSPPLILVLQELKTNIKKKKKGKWLSLGFGTRWMKKSKNKKKRKGYEWS